MVIVLGIVEQSTGQLSGGLGYSQSQGVFGQVQVQETNLLGRAWNLGLNVTYGQYGGLANLNFSDPWIYGDKHRTSFRTSVFLSQQVPQVFQSEDNGNIRTAKDYADNDSNKAYETGRNTASPTVIRLLAASTKPITSTPTAVGSTTRATRWCCAKPAAASPSPVP